MLPADLPRSLAYESEPSFDKRKAQIHEIEAKIRDEPRVKQLQLPVQRLDWALDRVIYYVASRDGMLPEVHLNDLIAALKGEEERARSRDLVDRLSRCIMPPNALTRGCRRRSINYLLRGSLKLSEKSSTFLTIIQGVTHGVKSGGAWHLFGESSANVSGSPLPVVRDNPIDHLAHPASGSCGHSCRLDDSWR